MIYIPHFIYIVWIISSFFLELFIYYEVFWRLRNNTLTLAILHYTSLYVDRNETTLAVQAGKENRMSFVYRARLVLFSSSKKGRMCGRTLDHCVLASFSFQIVFSLLSSSSLFPNFTVHGNDIGQVHGSW